MARLEGVGHDVVRRTNLSRVLRLLHGEGATTRAQLTAHIGLNRSTVAALVADLVERELVVEGDAQATGAPGRPSLTVCVRTDRVAVLAFDVRVDGLTAAVIALGGARLHVASRRHTDRGSIEATLTDLADLRDEVLAGVPADQHLVGVGVAVAGLVRRVDGLVHFAPNLGWEDVPLGALVSERLGLDVPVAVLNDGDAGAIGERLHGAGRGVDQLLFISGEVGVGGGVIIDGHPFNGRSGYAGEIGHLPVDSNGLPCRCGAYGCWETRIGETALLRLAGQPEDAGRAAVGTVLADARAGDEVALGALGELGRWLAVGLAGLVNMFDPHRIVLGGMHGALLPFLADDIDRHLRRYSLVGARSDLEVVPATLPDSALVGAGEMAFEGLLADPTLIAASPSPRPAAADAGGT